MAFNIKDRFASLHNSDFKRIQRFEFIQGIKKNKLLRYFGLLLRKKSYSKPTKGTHPVSKKIHIIYRHVYISDDVIRFPLKGRPPGFAYKLCFSNLIETIENSKYKENIKVTIFYNGTYDQFEKDQSLKIGGENNIDIDVQLIDANSALESVMIMLWECKNLDLDEDDILYILENDYIHDKNWIEYVLDAFNSNLRFDYLSLYDHPDRYKFPHKYKNSNLYAGTKRHWITAQSTCGSFMTRFHSFKRDFQYIYSCNSDHKMFSRLTKNLRRVLITPVPGLALHCMSDYLDPIVRFEDYFTNNEKQNNYI